MIRYLSVLALLLGFATTAVAAPSPTKLCSGGRLDGSSCTSNDNCPMGICVVARAVCDGGVDDGFKCQCPGSVCSSSAPCPNDPQSGTCVAGPRAGQCCSLEFGCSDGAPCVATQKVCAGGRFKGAACLSDSQCRDSTCTATAAACTAGIFAGFSCVDQSDCPAAACGGPNRCGGDCDRSGGVTVDEILVAVNVALGQVALADCTAADGNGDQAVTVDELLQSVNDALGGCPAPAATPTP